jgi:sulfate permease, SulP family
MPALAGLLILIGYQTIKPDDLVAVWRTGPVQKAVLSVTFALTVIIPLQFAVLVGVGLSVVLHVVQQSSTLTLTRWELQDDGTILETDPPAHLGEREIVVLQPYGSLFFAAAAQFDAALPTVDEGSRHSVVIVRLRGQEDLGTTFIDVLSRYAKSLKAVSSKLVIVSAGDRVRSQLTATGLTDLIGTQNIYRGRRRIGAAVRDAYADAQAWIDARPSDEPA